MPSVAAVAPALDALDFLLAPCGAFFRPLPRNARREMRIPEDRQDRPDDAESMPDCQSSHQPHPLRFPAADDDKDDATIRRNRENTCRPHEREERRRRADGEPLRLVRVGRLITEGGMSWAGELVTSGLLPDIGNGRGARARRATGPNGRRARENPRCHLAATGRS